MIAYKQAIDITGDGCHDRLLAILVVVASADDDGHPEVRRVYLFGSVTRQGYFHPGSDLDLAIEGLNPEQYFEFWHELSEAVPGCFIDLRDINEESHFSAVVRRSGELIYEREVPVAQG